MDYPPLTRDMDTPAARLERVLVGVTVTILFLTALALGEGRFEILGCAGDVCASASERTLVIPAIALLCLTILLILKLSKDKTHGDALLDRWLSREEEVVMRKRLELERFESADEGLGGRWAELERKGLEKRYGEEE